MPRGSKTRRFGVPSLIAGALGVVAYGAGFLGAGCARVPDVTFREGDAATDGVAAETDATTPIDTGSGCPSTVPSAAVACCGKVACSGDCFGDACQECASECGSSALCCARSGHKPTCRKSLSDKCPN
ncbi:MAG: hypothetical protein U0174_00920 [Polyangiaceae bacterium]